MFEELHCIEIRLVNYTTNRPKPLHKYSVFRFGKNLKSDDCKLSNVCQSNSAANDIMRTLKMKTEIISQGI